MQDSDQAGRESEKAEVMVRGLLEHGFWLSFPEPLESDFIREHSEEAFETQKKTALGLLVFAVLVGVIQGVIIWRMTPSVMLVHDLTVWTLGFWAILGSLSLSMLTTRLVSLKSWYVPLRALTCLVAVAAVQVCSWSLSYGYFARLSGYLALLVILAVFSFSRMRMIPAVSVVVIGTLIALAWSLILRINPDWLNFFQYIGLSLAYGVFMSSVLEYRDRRIFLQARLIDLEKQEMERLSYVQDQQARRDRLTGLISMYYFHELMDREWERAMREKQSISLLHMDIHRFTAFNQRYGYEAGNRCLAALARVFESVSKRAVDVCARYRNDEFLMLLPNTNAQGARSVQQVIEQEIARLQILHEDEVKHVLFLEIGVATVTPMMTEMPAQLLAAAEESLRLVQTSTTDTAIVW